MAQIVKETIQTDGAQDTSSDSESLAPTPELRQLHRARERARALRGFYSHLGVYIIVNLGIFTVNVVLVLMNSHQDWFFQWPLLGWGIALVINAFVVFTQNVLGPEWEDRKVQQYLNRQK